MYVYLREAFSPLLGFRYGCTLLTVIQTGTIAAVAIAFARFAGVLWPAISETRYLIAPHALGTGYAVSVSTAQALALAVILLATLVNVRGVEWGKLVQNVFTVAKLLGIVALLCLARWSRCAFPRYSTPTSRTPGSLPTSPRSAASARSRAPACLSRSVSRRPVRSSRRTPGTTSPLLPARSATRSATCRSRLVSHVTRGRPVSPLQSLLPRRASVCLDPDRTA